MEIVLAIVTVIAVIAIGLRTGLVELDAGPTPEDDKEAKRLWKELVTAYRKSYNGNMHYINNEIARVQAKAIPDMTRKNNERRRQIFI